MTYEAGQKVWGVRPGLNGVADDWVEFTLGERVGEPGGAGVVHKIKENTDPPLVAKLFHETGLAIARADSTAYLRTAFLAQHHATLVEKLDFVVWPRRMLFDRVDPPSPQQHVIGFTMRMLTGTVSLEHLINDISHHSKFRRITSDQIYNLAQKLALHVAELHRSDWGFVYVDMSPANIHVSADYKNIYFIDTDSFQYDPGDNCCFLPTGVTPRYTSPGAQDAIDAKKRLTPMHDDFLLAIHVFTLLMAEKRLNVHPFESQSRDADAMIALRQFPYDDPVKYPLSETELEQYQKLPEDIRAAFTQSFTRSPPVTAAEWGRLLASWRFHRRGTP